jgi:hypothetical protein
VAHLDFRSRDEEAVSNALWAFLGGFLGGFLYWATKAFLSRYIHWRREKIFLRFVRVTFPNSKTVEVISAASNDKQALANVERRLRNASRNL